MSDSTENKWTPSSKPWAPSGTSTWSPSAASADPVAEPASSLQSDAAEKSRIKLEERKLRLEEIKEKHRIDMEVRRQSFAEMQINRDWAKENDTKDGKEHWLKGFWRPMAGWLYMGICFMDFVGFPALYTFLPIIMRAFGITLNFVAWQSLTLSNGGLFHLAFGAILGVAAWTRGQEKIAATSNTPGTGTAGSTSGFAGTGSSPGGFGR